MLINEQNPVHNLMQSQNAVPPGLTGCHKSLRVDTILPGTPFAVPFKFPLEHRSR